MDRPAADVFDSALRVLGLPLPADAPVAYASYGLAKDAAYLVRPDAYVAVAEPTQATDVLDRYLAETGVRLG